jgi:hypothetical protein
MAPPLEQPQLLLDFQFFKPAFSRYFYFLALHNLQLLGLWALVDLH